MTALYQITAIGLVCGSLLSLCGSGGQREILRLGCACLTVIVLLSALQKTELPALDLRRYEEAVRPQVDRAGQELQDATLVQTERLLAEQLEQQAAGMGLDCGFTVVCHADSANNVTVRQVECRYRGGPREDLVELRERIKGQLAVEDGQIVIQEETP